MKTIDVINKLLIRCELIFDHLLWIVVFRVLQERKALENFFNINLNIIHSEYHVIPELHSDLNLDM